MGRLLTRNKSAAVVLACLLFGAGASFAQPAPPAASMDNLPKLSDRATGGVVRCPDGSTRPFSGTAPSNLVISVLCDVPADVAATRAAQADAAVAAKFAQAEQEAALAGQLGVMAGLKATAMTGRPDYLLAQPGVWYVGIVLAIFGLGALFGLRRRRS